jgi:hypothetical protein
VKYVDSSGNTLDYFKISLAPDGSIISTKNKMRAEWDQVPDDADLSARRRVLTAILAQDGELASNLSELEALGWDSDVHLAVLTREHARRLLDAFLARQVSAVECEQWAEALEAREDVGFEAGNEELLKRLVFELANPDITEPLTPQRGAALRSDLALHWWGETVRAGRGRAAAPWLSTSSRVVLAASLLGAVGRGTRAAVELRAGG